MKVAENENLQLDEDAALLIARVSDGALRDALSILDQCAGYNEPITVKTVGNAAGLLGKDYLFEISDALLQEDSAKILNIIDRLHSSSCDMERLMSELVNHFRNIMIAKTTKNPEKFIVCTPDELIRYKENAQNITYGAVLYIMETLCREASQLKYSAHQRAQTETALIRLCSPALSTDNAAIIRRIDELEAQIMLLKAQGVTVATPTATPVSVPEIKTEVETSAVKEPEKIREDKAVHNEPPIEEYYDDIPPEKPFTQSVIEPEKEVVTETLPKPEKKLVSHEPLEKPVDTGIVTEADNAVPFAAWENTLNQLSKINRPLYPMLIGSSAFRAGNTVFIKAKNTAFPQMFKQKTHADSITEALMRATGEKLKPMIYNDGSSPAAYEGIDPVDTFISKLNKHKIDFFIEE